MTPWTRIRLDPKNRHIVSMLYVVDIWAQVVAFERITNWRPWAVQTLHTNIVCHASKRSRCGAPWNAAHAPIARRTFLYSYAVVQWSSHILWKCDVILFRHQWFDLQLKRRERFIFPRNYGLIMRFAGLLMAGQSPSNCNDRIEPNTTCDCAILSTNAMYFFAVCLCFAINYCW